MKKILKAFTGLTVGAFAMLVAMTMPGAGTAEAYTSYNYTSKSNYTSYNNYSGYNYSNYQKPQTTQPAPVQQTPTTTQPTTQPTTQQMNVSVEDEQAMLNLINKERVAAGLKPLAYDAKLTELARMKAQDMITNNYFSHTSPTYGSPFDMMKKYGVVYHYAGENLAGAADVNTAHVNLMNSPGHKANILKAEYTKVGIGVVKGGKYSKIFVQLFNG
ncbi:hypothetical protein JCM14036_28530 [Desulfotomaculum defluvii]